MIDGPRGKIRLALADESTRLLRIIIYSRIGFLEAREKWGARVFIGLAFVAISELGQRIEGVCI